MRGYNQQKDSTNSNQKDSFLTKEIEVYTIKDCEDFLAKYPKDIDADKVRKRLEKLIPKNGCGSRSLQDCYSKPEIIPTLNTKSHKNPVSTVNRSKNTKRKKENTKDENGWIEKLDDFVENTILGKIVAFIIGCCWYLFLLCFFLHGITKGKIWNLF